MSSIRKLNAFLEYDEGEMTITIIDAVIEIGIHAWGVPLCLSLDRNNADLLIKIKNAPNTASTPTGGESTVKAASPAPAPLPSNQVEPVPPTSG